MLYELGASSAEDRAFWVEILTKASRFSIGSGDEERKGALSRRFLVTTRVGSRRREVLGERRGAINSGDSSSGVGGGVGGDARRDETVAVARCADSRVGFRMCVYTFETKLGSREHARFALFTRCAHAFVRNSYVVRRVVLSLFLSDFLMALLEESLPVRYQYQ